MKSHGIGTGVLIGAALTAPLLGLMYLVTELTSLPFAPYDFFDWITRVLPGSVVTFVVELRTLELPQLHLWDVDSYRDAINNFTLYRGIVLGISGLLALFLTVVFVVKGTAIRRGHRSQRSGEGNPRRTLRRSRTCTTARARGGNPRRSTHPRRETATTPTRPRSATIGYT